MPPWPSPVTSHSSSAAGRGPAARAQAGIEGRADRRLDSYLIIVAAANQPQPDPDPSSIARGVSRGWSKSARRIQSFETPRKKRGLLGMFANESGAFCAKAPLVIGLQRGPEVAGS